MTTIVLTLSPLDFRSDALEKEQQIILREMEEAEISERYLLTSLLSPNSSKVSRL